jgi:hypothetical protein
VTAAASVPFSSRLSTVLWVTWGGNMDGFI